MSLLALVSAMGPTVQVNISLYVNVMHYELDFWHAAEVNTATRAVCTYTINIFSCLLINSHFIFFVLFFLQKLGTIASAFLLSLQRQLWLVM